MLPFLSVHRCRPVLWFRCQDLARSIRCSLISFLLLSLTSLISYTTVRSRHILHFWFESCRMWMNYLFNTVFFKILTDHLLYPAAKAPRECFICGHLAEYECLQCLSDRKLQAGRIKQYCTMCNTQVSLTALFRWQCDIAVSKLCKTPLYTFSDRCTHIPPDRVTPPKL